MAGRTGGAYLDIDVSDAVRLMHDLGKALTSDQMRKLEYRVVKRTGSKVKTFVKNDVVKEYKITKSVVGRDIRRPRMGGGGDISCSIPIVGRRHIIGGKTFPAKGGRYGWRGIMGGNRYAITTEMVKGQTTVLPGTMRAYGGNPPFRNLSAARLNQGAYTRSEGAGKPPRNLPIVRVAGIAVPQMPMNRAREDVQEDIATFMQERIEHEYSQLIGGVR